MGFQAARAMRGDPRNRGVVAIDECLNVQEPVRRAVRFGRVTRDAPKASKSWRIYRVSLRKVAAPALYRSRMYGRKQRLTFRMRSFEEGQAGGESMQSDEMASSGYDWPGYTK